MLTNKEKYDNFKQTIYECNSDILLKEDEDVKYYLLEELPVDIVSYLHSNTLDILLNDGIIDEKIYNKSISLREKYLKIEIEMPQLLNIQDIKLAKEWREIFELSDEILALLYW